MPKKYGWMMLDVKNDVRPPACGHLYPFMYCIYLAHTHILQYLQSKRKDMSAAVPVTADKDP